MSSKLFKGNNKMMYFPRSSLQCANLTAKDVTYCLFGNHELKIIPIAISRPSPVMEQD